MRQARVFVQDKPAGILIETDAHNYTFKYDDSYTGLPVSVTMPIQHKVYQFNTFPPFFEGLLPEDIMLDALLRQYKIDKYDYFSQLIITGDDLVGSVTLKEIK